MTEQILAALFEFGRGLVRHFRKGGTAAELSEKRVGDIVSRDALEQVEKANDRADAFVEGG